jgi:hypothetical protein
VMLHACFNFRIAYQFAYLISEFECNFFELLRFLVFTVYQIAYLISECEIRMIEFLCTVRTVAITSSPKSLFQTSAFCISFHSAF